MCELFSVTSTAFALCIQATTYGGQAEDPFAAGTFQGGMNVFMTQTDYEETEDFIWSVQLLLDRLYEADVNAVSLTWPIFTESVWSTRIFAGAESPNETVIATFVAIAKARGFGVILHPVLDEAAILKAGPVEWRGTIRPRSIDDWFTSYGTLMVDYAELAESVGADALVVGAELDSMERYQTHWTQLVADVRKEFPSGSVTYAANRFISSTFPWDVVDFISVDAFFDLDVSLNASAEQMASAMTSRRDEMLAQAAEIGLPLVFTEIGTTSQEGSFHRTWVWNHRTDINLESQERYYQAVCEVWKEHIEGLYWWTTTLHPLSADEALKDGTFDPLGKPAEAVIRECF